MVCELNLRRGRVVRCGEGDFCRFGAVFLIVLRGWEWYWNRFGGYGDFCRGRVGVHYGVGIGIVQLVSFRDICG